jgi:hypothetical protein
MSGKAKPPNRFPAKQSTLLLPPPQPKPADTRWQRTVRYVWDKGGAKGGRK